jgi:hypothetical protein
MDREVKFDTYSKHTGKYQLLPIGLLMLFALGVYVNVEKKQPITPFVAVTLILSVIITIIGIIVKSLPSDGLYKKDGELILYTDSILLDNVKYQLSEISRTEFVVYLKENAPRGKFPPDNTANSIKIYTNSNAIIKKSFAFTLPEQYHALKTLLLEWKKEGNKVKVDGFDLWVK